MRALIISQKVADSYISILKNALPDDCAVDVITGSQLQDFDYIKAPAHDPQSLVSRLKCWYKFYTFVRNWAKNCERRYDFIFATSNPPVNGILGVKLKRFFNARFVYMNWDLYPQVIQCSMHGIVPRVFCWCWDRVNQVIYPKIDQMLTIGQIMSETINTALKRKIPVEVIPMFTDTNRLKPLDKSQNVFCLRQGLTDRFIVLFSGKMGLGHNLVILLEASRRLRQYKDILFLFIGHGQRYEYVKKWIKEEKAENVILLPLQPEEIFPQSMACGDIGFISQEEASAKCFMPAKTYDMMACGMALLAYSEGTDDLSNLIHKYDLGYVITENQPEILIKAILDLYGDRSKLQYYARNARVVAVSQFDIKVATGMYRKVFERVLCGDMKGSI